MTVKEAILYCGARMDGGDFDEMPNIKSQE